MDYFLRPSSSCSRFWHAYPISVCLHTYLLHFVVHEKESMDFCCWTIYFSPLLRCKLACYLPLLPFLRRTTSFLLPSSLSPSPSIAQCCFCSLYCRLLPLLWGSWPCRLAMWRRISSFMQVGKLQVFIGHHIIWFPVTFLGCSTAFKREEEHSLHVKLLV